MKLNTYLVYAILASSISLITEISANQIRVANNTDGQADVIIDIAAASSLCPNHEIHLAPQSEQSFDIGLCCVKAIHVFGITGSIKGQKFERDFGIACHDISIIVNKNNDNSMRIDLF
ncbi:MAG TPA: hypothetical protein VGW78_03695 [Candidatus Babeliales bacterium]|jgi:hypothetical protein|nr:hypothetical protein [Candidatus Babeliales bacterium]